MTLDPGELRLEWRPAEPGGWPGQLRVFDGDAGSSVAELRVESAGAVGFDGVQQFLDRALRGLAEEVDQNFLVS